jgi:hypothetical protein
MNVRPRPFGQARAGGWGGRGELSRDRCCNQTGIASANADQSERWFNLCNDFGGSGMRITPQVTLTEE